MPAAVEQSQRPAGMHEQGHVRPVFVTGVWRCGATLLYLLLNRHPDITLLFESDLALLWPMFRLPWKRNRWVDKWEFWNASISRHDLNPAHLSPSVQSLAEAFEAAGYQYAAQRGKKRWGCKSPSYLYRLEGKQFRQARPLGTGYGWAVTCGTASPGYCSTHIVFDSAAVSLANVSRAQGQGHRVAASPTHRHISH